MRRVVAIIFLGLRLVKKVEIMEEALIAFIGVILLGVVIYVSAWMDGSTWTKKVTKWFFGIFFVAALITGGYFYFIGDF